MNRRGQLSSWFCFVFRAALVRANLSMPLGDIFEPPANSPTETRRAAGLPVTAANRPSSRGSEMGMGISLCRGRLAGRVIGMEGPLAPRRPLKGVAAKSSGFEPEKKVVGKWPWNCSEYAKVG